MATEQIKITTELSEKIEMLPIRAKTAVNPKIRAGIVGAGLMGLWHAHAVEKVGGRVVGFADFDVAKAERLAARHARAKAYGAVEKMLAEQNLDVLHVCSPTASHKTVAEKAIRAGVHLLIEKPLAPTADQTAKLYELAAQNGTLLCPVHQFAFQDGVTKAKKDLPKIGRLVHLEANICSAGGAGFNGEQLDLIGADILPHPLSLMQRFLGSSFSETDWRLLRRGSGELRIFGQTGETSLSIFISLNSRPTTNSFYLFGTNGTIRLDLFHGYSVIEPGITSKTRKILHPFDLALRSFSAAGANLAWRILRDEPAYPGLRRLIYEFYNSIQSNSDLPVTPSEAIAIAEIRDLLVKNQEK